MILDRARRAKRRHTTQASAQAQHGRKKIGERKMYQVEQAETGEWLVTDFAGNVLARLPGGALAR
jgi:hypothetical protein